MALSLALRDAELDAPGVLLNYPRMEPTAMKEVLKEVLGVIVGDRAASPGAVSTAGRAVLIPQSVVLFIAILVGNLYRSREDPSDCPRRCTPRDGRGQGNPAGRGCREG